MRVQERPTADDDEEATDAWLSTNATVVPLEDGSPPPEPPMRRTSLEARLKFYRSLTAKGHCNTDSGRGVRFHFEPPPHVVAGNVWTRKQVSDASPVKVRMCLQKHAFVFADP